MTTYTLTKENEDQRNSVSWKEQQDGHWIVYTRHVDDSIEPHVVDSEEEANKLAIEVLLEQEKQSNEKNTTRANR